MRLSTLIEMAKVTQMSRCVLPEAGLRELVFKPSYANWVNTWPASQYTCGVLDTARILSGGLSLWWIVLGGCVHRSSI